MHFLNLLNAELRKKLVCFTSWSNFECGIYEEILNEIILQLSVVCRGFFLSIYYLASRS